MDFTISKAAEKFIRRMTRMSGIEGSGFRLVVTTGGCSGLAAEFNVEAAPLPNDAVIDYDGIKLFLPAESRLLLHGVKIDFADTPTLSGFVFHNASTSSACGTSAPAPAKLVSMS